MRYCDVLTESGIEVNRIDFNLMQEAAQLKVTDDALTGMMKFITDKYNSLDFGEIEKSAGDITRFKYTRMIMENAEMLGHIYQDSTDPGASKYIQVIDAIHAVISHLNEYRSVYSTLYKNGNGVVQLMYTSMVAGCLYATGTLVSNTIRFVTTEQDTDCDVLYEEIPGTIKHVHIKNILAVAKDLNRFVDLIEAMAKPTNRNAVSESVSATTVAAVVFGVGGIIFLIPRVLMLIREIIYSIYYSRVKVSEMLDLQAELIRTNIESLEQGRGNKKVIARQKRIAQKLESWKNKVALKMDTTEVMKKTQQRKEDASLRLDRNSPLVQDAMSSESDGLLL